jgi:hypothetical protein
VAQLTARVLRAEALASADGAGAAVDLGSDVGPGSDWTVELDLVVTAISGTLTVVVETSRHATIGWREVVPKAYDEDGEETEIRFDAVTAPGAQFIVFPDCERYVRVRWTLTSTATFAVFGSSVRVYARVRDVPALAVGCNCKKVSSERIDRAIRSQTDHADSYLGNEGPVPLSVWPDNIKDGVATCAAVAIIVEDGMKLRQEDELLIKRCEAFDQWLEQAGEGDATVPGGVDPTPAVPDGGAYAVSDAKRGW